MWTSIGAKVLSYTHINWSWVVEMCIGKESVRIAIKQRYAHTNRCSLGINIHSKAIHMWVFKVVVCWSFLKIKSCNNVLVFQAVLLSRGIDSRCQGIFL